MTIYMYVVPFGKSSYYAWTNDATLEDDTRGVTETDTPGVYLAWRPADYDIGWWSNRAFNDLGMAIAYAFGEVEFT